MSNIAASSSSSALLQLAVDMFGSQAKLAAAVGLSQPAISLAIRTGRVSAELATKVHRATGGAVHRASLCPEIFGDIDAKQNAGAP